MNKKDNILSKLKNKVVSLIKQLDAISKKKRDELSKIEDIKQKYNYMKEIISSDLPVNSESLPIFEAINSSANYSSIQISKLFETAIQNEQIYFAVNTTAANTVSTIVSYPEFSNVIPSMLKENIYSYLSGEHERKKQKISKFLNNLSPHLSNTYLGAYENLSIVSYDPERGAIALMREVVNQTLGILASDDEIKKQTWYLAEPSSKTGVTRKHRIRYITEVKARNHESAELIMNNADLFDLIVEKLNKMHERNKLDVIESRGFFYQAEELLEILAGSINL